VDVVDVVDVADVVDVVDVVGGLAWYWWIERWACVCSLCTRIASAPLVDIHAHTCTCPQMPQAAEADRLVRNLEGALPYQALCQLALGADDTSIAVAVVAAGGIPRIVQLLRSASTDTEAMAAVSALDSLTLSSDSAPLFVAAGAIPPMVQLLRSVCTDAAAVAATALYNLARNSGDITRAIVAAGAIPPMVQLLRNASTDVVRVVATRALDCLNFRSENTTAIVSAGAIPLLVQLLRSGSTDAASALCHIAVNVENATAIVAAGAIPPLVKLLVSCSMEAATALHNLAVNVENATAIVAAGAIPPLVELLGRSVQEKEASASILRLLIKYAVNQVVTAGAIPLLVRLLGGAARYFAMALLDDLAFENTAAIVAAGAISPLVELLRVPYTADVQDTAALVLRRLIKYDAAANQVVAAGAIPLLVRLLTGAADRTSVVGLLDDIALDNAAIVVAAGAIPPLVQLLGSASTDSVHQMVTGTLAWLASDHALSIVSAGAIPPLVALLDTRVVPVVQHNAGCVLKALALERGNFDDIIADAVIPLMRLALGAVPEDGELPAGQKVPPGAELLLELYEDEDFRLSIDAVDASLRLEMEWVRLYRNRL
jgi:hypothetical protein